MKRFISIISVLSIIILTGSLFAQQYENRKEIPGKYTWNLMDLYQNLDAWKAAKADLEQKMMHITDFQGKLTRDAKTLEEALDFYFSVNLEMSKLWSYAQRLVDQNLNNAKNQELTQSLSMMWTRFSEASSYVVPELIEAGSERLKSMMKENKGLNEYSSFLKDVLRQQQHTLTKAEEKIMATTGLITGGPSTVYSIFNNAEIPRPKVKLANGETVNISSSEFVKYRTVPNREDRIKVFKAFFENYGRFKNTIGANLAAQVKNHYFIAKNRKYKSSLEAALDRNNIPTSVYENLVKQINVNLNVLHRYLKLRKRILGVDTLHYYDIYVPLTKAVDLKYSIEDGQKIISSALKPMGKEYIKNLRAGFDNRWVDYFPTPGKRSGAYSTGSEYDVHPYVLLNWHGDYESLTTFAHEMGHAMHSYFSNKYQPYAKSDYSIFVAEIASTFNENLLNHYLVKNAKSNEEKLFLLGSYLEGLRGTVFRQTQFAEFEWEIHKKIEAGQPLTGEAMSQLYMEITKRYYGHDEGICVVDPWIQYEWEYIPHFYYNFYVYQYATSLIYSTAISQKVIKKGQKAVDNYFKLLKGGNSQYPTELVKAAGVDPFSSEAFDLTMKRMNDVMDQIEKILDKMGK